MQAGKQAGKRISMEGILAIMESYKHKERSLIFKSTRQQTRQSRECRKTVVNFKSKFASILLSGNQIKICSLCFKTNKEEDSTFLLIRIQANFALYIASVSTLQLREDSGMWVVLVTDIW